MTRDDMTLMRRHPDEWGLQRSVFFHCRALEEIRVNQDQSAVTARTPRAAKVAREIQGLREQRGHPGIQVPQVPKDTRARAGGLSTHRR